MPRRVRIRKAPPAEPEVVRLKREISKLEAQGRSLAGELVTSIEAEESLCAHADAVSIILALFLRMHLRYKGSAYSHITINDKVRTEALKYGITREMSSAIIANATKLMDDKRDVSRPHQPRVRYE